MKYTHLIVMLLFVTGLVSSCKQHQEARRPISQASGSFMKKSVARNKKLVATEEDQIQAVIKSTPTMEYIASSKGYWYAYETKNLTDTLTPKKGDIAYFDYEIKDLNGAVIYTQEELKPQAYRVDKEDIMMGLRNGIKLLHKTEKVIFLFPSHMGFGYHGDNKKIGVNQPLMCTVTLRDFKPEPSYKKTAPTSSTEAIAPETTETIVKKVKKETAPKPQLPAKKTVTTAKDTLK